MEINGAHPNEDKQKPHSELAIVREPVTTICSWQRLKRQAEEWESFTVEKKMGGFRFADRRLVVCRLIGSGTF